MVPWLVRRYRRSPTFLLVTWFTTLLLVGAVLLYLPISHIDNGIEVSFLTSLFTATSAACVTGLTVVDTPAAFSLFGQAVLLCLMELGGIGILTFANLGFHLIGRRLSLTERTALVDTLFPNDTANLFRSTFVRIVKTLAIIQSAGFVCLAAFLIPDRLAEGEGFAHALWSSLFHSVSAFCNAGFSLYHGNLVAESTNTGFLVVVAALIILGGIGHSALAELWNLPRALRRRSRKVRLLTLHTRIVLILTVVLLVSGGALVFIFGDGAGDHLGHAFFQSVSARTAGFNSIPLDKLPLTTCLVLCILMFIGGSPGSCAGGVKTTSLAVWLAHLRATLRNDYNVNIYGYTIEPELVNRARILISMSLVWNLLGIVILSIFEPGVGLDEITFEQISAFATVGLSMGLTPELSGVSQVWIILSMYIGRLGPLTIILWIMPGAQRDVKMPSGKVMVG